MGHNKPVDRYLFTIGGSTKTSGGSADLAKGQLALADAYSNGSTGVKLISTTNGMPRRERRLAIKLGITDKDVTRSRSNKAMSTEIFSLDDIKDISVSAPVNTTRSVDEFVLGYNGIDPATSFSFKKGDSPFNVTIEVSGDSVAFLGNGQNKILANVAIPIRTYSPSDTCTTVDDCDTVDCKTIIYEAVRQLNAYSLGSGKTLSDVAEITPVTDCDTGVTATLIPYTYYTLSVCDSGSQSALALVQAQLGSTPVKIYNRVGGTSTYQCLLPTSAGAPTAYVQSIASIIKDCNACPASYTATAGGILYSFSIEDSGVDKTALVTAMPNYVANTVKREVGHLDGVGYYTAVFSAEFTDAQITTILTAAVPSNTIIIDKIGPVSALCTNSTTTTINWVAGDVCNAIAETYEITVPDTTCGTNRLADLQKIFPTNTVTIAQVDTANTQQVVTLTGTSGTANIAIAGTNYLATFATNLSTTAINFVTANAATILAAKGVTVTASGVTLIFTHTTASFPTITIANATTNLAGTVGATSVVQANATGGCSTKYVASTVSNLVCDACDPIFKDYYRTDPLKAFENINWVKQTNAASTPSGNCLCGIRVKGKTFDMNPEEALRGQVAFMETSTKVNGAAGFVVEVREGIGFLPTNQYNAYYLSRWADRTHLGGHFLPYEEMSRVAFADQIYSDDYLRKVLLGERSNIEDLKSQYVVYTVHVELRNYSGGGGLTGRSTKYHFAAEVGRHQNLELLMNDLASNSGHSPVRAFGA